jgi:hypothetical protein
VIINNDAYRLATSGLGKLVVPTRPSEQTRCRKRLELPKLWPEGGPQAFGEPVRSQ